MAPFLITAGISAFIGANLILLSYHYLDVAISGMLDEAFDFAELR